MAVVVVFRRSSESSTVEVHLLVDITCGSLPSTTDSGTRADQMRYAATAAPPHPFVCRAAASTRSATLPGQGPCVPAPARTPLRRAGGRQVQLVLRQRQEGDDGLLVAGRHDPTVRLGALGGRVHSERWPGGRAGHCRYGAALDNKAPTSGDQGGRHEAVGWVRDLPGTSRLPPHRCSSWHASTGRSQASPSR